MKIRSGFVSNSSSSSFIVAGVSLTSAEFDDFINNYPSLSEEDRSWLSEDPSEVTLPSGVEFFTDDYYHYIGVEVSPTSFNECCLPGRLVSEEQELEIKNIAEIYSKRPYVHSWESY